MTVMAPADEAGVVEVVRAAASDGASLEIEGGGSRRGLGRPVQAERTLSLKQLAGVTLYAPGELVIRARAGTPVADVQATLDEAGQQLPFEPPDLRRLFGNDAAAPTIGGLVATNASGPARIARGALRDSLIGVRFVDGEAEVSRSGGRVMKNVTGLDLVKLQAGAYGTLGVLTEATFKVLPKTQATRTVVVQTPDAEAAGEAMRAALATPFEVSGAAYLPEALVQRTTVAALRAQASGLVLLRLEYFTEFLERRCRELVAEIGADGQASVLDDEPSLALWTDVRDVLPLVEPRKRAVWRLSVAPAAGPGLLTRLTEQLGGEGYLDWSGGLLWLAVDASGDAGAAVVRPAVAETGGHATLIRAPAAVRAAIDVFEPEPEALAALTRRLKLACDPNRLLNPGRMYAGV